MKRRAAVVIAWMVLAWPLVGQGLAGSGDPEAIRHLLMATFDTPGSPLAVNPVSIEGDIAVAGWAQGEMGGRALLRRRTAHGRSSCAVAMRSRARRRSPTWD